MDRPSTRPSARRSESLHGAVSARRFDCGTKLWVPKALHRGGSSLPSGAQVSRTASIVDRRCAFSKQPSTHAIAYTGHNHSLYDDLPPLCASRRRSLGEAGDLGYPSTAGGVGSAVRIIPDAHEDGSDTARPEHSDAADACSVRKHGGH